MATYKRSVDFLPRMTSEEVEEKFKVSRAAIYAAALPLLASFIWVVAMFINSYYASDVKKVENTITEKKTEIDSYNYLREKQTQLVLKVENLEKIVLKDFFPQQFFDIVTETIKSTGDAQAKIYSYERVDDGTFIIQGKANSYLDLAKIMVAFNQKDEFYEVKIESIRYDEEEDNVNFEISFVYIEEVVEDVV